MFKGDVWSLYLLLNKLINKCFDILFYLLKTITRNKDIQLGCTDCALLPTVKARGVKAKIPTRAKTFDPQVVSSLLLVQCTIRDVIQGCYSLEWDLGGHILNFIYLDNTKSWRVF